MAEISPALTISLELIYSSSAAIMIRLASSSSYIFLLSTQLPATSNSITRQTRSLAAGWIGCKWPPQCLA